MLKKFRISNFGGIDKMIEMDLTISSSSIIDHTAKKLNKIEGVNLVSTVIGANASGKTTVLKSLAYVLFAIKNSYQIQIQDAHYRPFVTKEDDPTVFELEFNEDSEEYLYKISINKAIFVSEFLGQKNRGVIAEYFLMKDLKIIGFLSKVRILN